MSRHLCAFLSCVLILLAMPQDGEGQEKARKFALLVAIDHYGAKYTPRVPQGQQWAALGGTVNDVSLLAAELEQRGFEVTILANSKATRAGIVSAFRKSLIGKAKAGRKDVVFFHYSGHGQQIPDDNGPPDEVDGYDESLVPFDNLGTHNYSNHLRDEQLGNLVKEMAAKTPNVIISLDSCHSGTGTRGSLKVRGGPPVHPPAKDRATAQDKEVSSGLLEPVLTRGSGPKRHGYVLISATLPTQLAKEVDDPRTKQSMGAFTWSLVRALRRSKSTTTWQQLMDQVAVEVSSRVSDQSPQIEGDTDNVIFSGEWVASPSYFKVKPLGDDGLYPIEAGRLHGLTMGSIMGLYPPGSGAMDPKRPAVKAKVTRLEVGQAWVKPEGAAKAATFKLGGRAIELVSQHTPNRLRVFVTDEAKALRKQVEKTKFIALVPSDNATDPRGNPAWDLKVSLEAGQIKIARVDGTPVLIPRGPEKPMEAMLPEASPDRSMRFEQAIKVEVRRRKILSLINDDVSSRAEVSLRINEVDAVRVPNRHPRVTKVNRAVTRDGQGVLKQGDIIQFEVENRSERDLHFSIVELSPDGNIDVIYPVDGMRTGENKVSKASTRTLKVLFQIRAPSGRSTFKIIATEDDVDFRSLTLHVKSGSTRGAPTRGAKSPLAQLMEMAMDGTRAKPFGYAPAKLWGADAFEVTIK